eukprot:m.147434 g.147434  ORF g.147434 m.147434 type:complete len:428 (-) comp24351_c0_seq2:2805-4088(-)
MSEEEEQHGQLSLCHMRLRSLPPTLPIQHPHLQRIFLSGNHLSALPDTFATLAPTLHVLDLSRNAFELFPPVIKLLVGLTQLNLSWNSLDGLDPQSVAPLKKLELANFGHNSIPKSLWVGGCAEPPHITTVKLILQCNLLETFPANVYDCDLKHLNLSHCTLSVMPELPSDAIWFERSLRTLDVTHNCLESLPSSIGRLVHLSVLLAGWNKLTSLPDSLSQIQQLEHLSLARNQLTSVDVIGSLVALQVCDLSFNKIPSLPDNMSNLSMLDTLKLPDNLLTTLPASLSDTPVRRLDCNRNRITVLPESLALLVKTLTSFTVQQNAGLRQLPPSFAWFQTSEFRQQLPSCGMSKQLFFRRWQLSDHSYLLRAPRLPYKWIVFVTLASTRRRFPKYFPPEMWIHVFSFLRIKDFGPHLRLYGSSTPLPA